MENCSEKFLERTLRVEYIEEIYNLSSDIFDIYHTGCFTTGSAKGGLLNIEKTALIDLTKTNLNFLQLITEEPKTGGIGLNNTRFMKNINELSTKDTVVPGEISTNQKALKVLALVNISNLLEIVIDKGLSDNFIGEIISSYQRMGETILAEVSRLADIGDIENLKGFIKNFKERKFDEGLIEEQMDNETETTAEDAEMVMESPANPDRPHPADPQPQTEDQLFDDGQILRNLNAAPEDQGLKNWSEQTLLLKDVLIL